MNYIKMEFSEEKVIALKFQHSPIIYFNIVFTTDIYTVRFFIFPQTFDI